MAIQVINQIQARSITSHSPYVITELMGLSTDTKPMTYERGSTLEETDSGNIYKFDGTVWYLDEVSDSKNMATLDNAGRQNFNGIFGDKFMSMRSPKITANFNYPPDTRSNITTTTNGGTVGIVGNLLTIQTSTNINGNAIIQSRESLRYTAGRDAEMFFTTIFTQGVPNSYQRAGLFDAEDGFFVGFEGNQFGVTIRKNGSDIFIPQSSFNKDKIDGSGISKFLFVPTFMNLFRLVYGYLGIAPVFFEIYMGNELGWVVFHVHDVVNKQIGTHIQKPYLPVRAEVKNNGNNTNIILRSGSVYAGVIDGNPNAVDSSSREFTQRATRVVNNTTSPLIVFNNKSTYGGTSNKIADLLLKVGFSTSSASDLVSVILYKLPSVPIGGTWTDVDASNSNMRINTTATVSLTGAQILDAWELTEADSKDIDTEKRNYLLYPDEYAVFMVTTTNNTTINAVIRWAELF